MHSNNLKSFEEIIHLRNKTVCARDYSLKAFEDLISEKSILVKVREDNVQSSMN